MDGHLHIKAKREAFGSRHYTSARLATKGKADWRYGRIEVRLRPPVGRGTWAAVWMLPTSSKYGDWPRCGEIDIMEHVGLDPGKVHGTIHTEMCNHKKGTQVGNILDAGLGEWHTYGVAWSHDRLNFFYDGQRYLTVTKAHLLGLPDAFSFPFNSSQLGRQEKWASEDAWPFNKSFYIVLCLGCTRQQASAHLGLRNVAVGGDWGGQKGIDDEALAAGQVMDVAWVRVYGSS